MTDGEIDALICRHVFNQVPCDGWMPGGSWNLVKVCKDHADGECYPRGKEPEYSSNPAACKQVREKLAERYHVSLHRYKTYASCSLERTSPPLYPDLYPEPVREEWYFAEADTEEHAVCLCALKTVGISVGSENEV